ncbi:JAB domain-containing protein [Peribacillus frigoritolerans]|uniref:JAB domain-containing protein n=1 Tax=Peribacillus frigoritolerans TaxID=450367 RepID=UPI00207949E1|nr:JAB domain-containing protein [Peribacillus frigoritolerans]USK77816.1 DNA repair protein RadC [Peribacillus frigoritolerans]
MFAEKLKTLYPVKRQLSEERIVREKVKGSLYHIPQVVVSPQMGFETIMGIMNLEKEAQEVFGVMAINSKNKVIGFDIISIGSLDATIAHPREVFKKLILRNAATCICFHNHTSASIPSKEDIEVTKRLVEVGHIIGIPLRDHLITGDNGKFTSMSEKGFI